MIPDISIAASFPANVPRIIPVRDVPDAWRVPCEIDGFSAKPETACDIFAPYGRILLVGLRDAHTAGAFAASKCLRCPHIAIDATELTASEAADFLAGICLRAWRFDTYFSRVAEDVTQIAKVTIVAENERFAKSWAKRRAAIEGATFARDLVSEPANVLTPENFIARLKTLTGSGISLKVLDAATLRAENFGGLIAVGQGSRHPPCLAILRWPGSIEAPPVVFVGKGITFDTGGISIKPADKMWDMRADMAGAAACAGALLALARRNSPAPAIAILAIAENTAGANSYRPGDVLRMHSGATVQVVDTDAEGRLVLADALAYAVDEKPQAVIDLATLTGSIVTALGHEMAGCFDNDPALAAAAAAAGAAVGEKIWRMPIGETHRRALDSNIADLKHCVDERGQPDACQAAAFLREFVGDTPWLHLDIAGVESREEASATHAKGATGFGVRLLDRLIADRFEDPHRV